MAFNVTAANLTPSRPAPQAPLRRTVDSASPSQYNSGIHNTGYNATFSSGSSYASDYTGIGGSPNRYSDTPMSSHVIRNGVVSLKEEGFASFMFLRKWLVLKGELLTIHRNEVRRCSIASSLLCWPRLLMCRCDRLLHPKARSRCRI